MPTKTSAQPRFRRPTSPAANHPEIGYYGSHADLPVTCYPIHVDIPVCQSTDLQHNRSLLNYSYELNQRPLIRVSFEVWGAHGGIGQYRRLHKKHATLSCPYWQQAEMAIEYVLNSIKFLNGKWLKEGPNGEAQ